MSLGHLSFFRNDRANLNIYEEVMEFIEKIGNFLESKIVLPKMFVNYDKSVVFSSLLRVNYKSSDWLERTNQSSKIDQRCKGHTVGHSYLLSLRMGQSWHSILSLPRNSMRRTPGTAKLTLPKVA